MRRVRLSIPELGIIAGTRAAGGAGVALLLSGHLSQEKRRAIGWTLLAVGVISTIPIIVELLSESRSGQESSDPGLRRMEQHV